MAKLDVASDDVPEPEKSEPAAIAVDSPEVDSAETLLEATEVAEAVVPAALTQRQLEVLRLVAIGLTNR